MRNNLIVHYNCRLYISYISYKKYSEMNYACLLSINGIYIKF